MPSRTNTQLVLPGLFPDNGPGRWRKGDRAQLSPGTATGTIERVRDDVGEVLWDTGARCRVPLAWIDQPRRGPRPGAASVRKQRHETEAWKREQRARTCRSCGRAFSPKRSDQAFCTASCRKRAHRNGATPGATKAVASRDDQPPATTAFRVCAHCGGELGGMRSDARYCGDACRRASHRKRVRTRQ